LTGRKGESNVNTETVNAIQTIVSSDEIVRDENVCAVEQIDDTEYGKDYSCHGDVVNMHK
jgi:hypothetical protein